ncbi:MAG: biotin synthase BioB [Verrucomicrobia bacterium]|nr:biotin synthase BioB [Verrucomicrobiota bacterium]
MDRDEVLALAGQVAGGHETTCGEALRLASDETSLDDLTAGAARLVERFGGRTVEFCAIVNAKSGFCPNDCTFCAQSVHYSTDTPVYELMDTAHLVEAARAAAASGASRFGIVTSGVALDEADFDRLIEAVRALIALGVVGVCASLGALTSERARRLRAAGLVRYHHNVETSEGFYPEICTTQRHATKLDTLETAKAAGLEVCSGGIFGLGETWADRVDMAMTLRELGVVSAPLNFLMPIAGTPLERQAMLTADEALRIIAVYRFILPRTTIRVCGGRDAVLGARQAEMYAAGADAAMTGNYLTRPGHRPEEDLAMVAALGLGVRRHVAPRGSA